MAHEVSQTYLAILALTFSFLCLPIIRRPAKGVCLRDLLARFDPLIQAYRSQKLRSIPTLGPSGFLFATFNSIRFLVRGRNMIEEANKRFQATGLFKMQFFSGWNVFVLRQDYIADLRGSRDKDLSLYHAQNDVSSSDLTALPSMSRF